MPQHAAPLVVIHPPRHHVEIDLVYAGADNLTGRPIYRQPCCLLHPDAERALESAIRIAALAGLRLRILDAYRPAEAQRRLWDALPDSRYVADLERGSHHSRGVALDVTLVDGDGSVLDMGTAFDEMSERSHPFHPAVEAASQRNRLLLLAIMTQAGFRPIATEWWHFELDNAIAYPLVDDERLTCLPLPLR
ncbi:D-alanyl-D-alanine dipeptidase [Paludibacterium yongneupense]|uniref:D-alanyl-D-alanine dipeptidase n=1 Tax=Paludibacterium yongneupense TaxID=400061 RepID=UPI000427395E|nr:D-alanyl-D-alanine dipeptidase [Paludibacterium yongneupense]